MGIGELLLIACSLAMDAFAVSVCRGLSMKRVSVRDACIAGLWFGLFQALMPLIGWFLGAQFIDYIEVFDHWIAFGLLLLIGGNMIFDAVREGEQCDVPKGMLLPALATSIDALAMGVAFSMIGQDCLNIWGTVLAIGLVTFILCVAGVLIGSYFGTRFLRGAKIAGGIVLILIGAKIVLDHLHILS